MTDSLHDDPAKTCSGLFRVLQPCRDVALSLQHTPDIDVVLLLDVEHKVREAIQMPRTQTRQVEFMRITR